jgi:hypothetical protein
MAFVRWCKSDPLLDFIRETYNAIPLKLPDARVTPLTVFEMEDGRSSFLGSLTLLAPSGWKPPRVDSTDVPTIVSSQSSQLKVGAALDVLGPFVAAMSGLAGIDIAPTFKASTRRGEGIRVSLGRARRMFVSPIACARQFETFQFRFPATLKLARNDGSRVLLVDGVLSARELTLGLEGESAHELAVAIKSDLAGKVSNDAAVVTKSKLTITASKHLPFAFTCLELGIGRNRTISGLKLLAEPPRAGAAAVSTAAAIEHTMVGARNESFAFDD